MESNSKEREIFNKLCRFCAYRERAKIELFNKMDKLELDFKQQERFIKLLEEENFINEPRFARSFTLGKFRNNSWGKNKIYYGLKEKRIASDVIDKALLNIDQEEYELRLSALIRRKYAKLKTTNLLVTRQKIASYLMQKGFEASLVWETLKHDLPDV